MKSSILADIHTSLYGQDPIIPESNLPEKLHSINKTVRWVLDWSRMNHILNCFILGDTNHNKSIIHTLAMSVFIDIIRDYPDLHFTIIDGNHDMSSKSGTGVSSLRGLDKEENVTMIHETKQIENMLFVPWTHTLVDDVKKGKADYLFSHFGVNEAQLSSGISVISDIGLKDLKHYKHVFLGHYHKPQDLANVTYIGSPVQLDRGERGEEKRFIVFDSETGEKQSILTEGYKKYIELNISSANKDEVLIEAEKLQNEGHHVTINRIEKINIGEKAKIFNITDKVEIDITNRGVTTSMSDEEKLNKYISIKEPPEEQKEFLLKVGIQLLDEARSEYNEKN